MKSKVGSIIATSILLAACAAEDVPDDPRDEDVIIDGKSDAFGIIEGSPDAEGILELVNTAPKDTLRAEVGLGAVVSDNLVAHRAGQDGLDDTSDDDLFDDLLELDRVPFVGSTSFSKLLQFARANGYVPQANPDDPFDPASCDGPPMQLAEIDQRLGTLGLYQFQLRTKRCPEGPNKPCEDWVTQPVTFLPWASAASGEALLGKTSAGERRIWLYASRSCPTSSLSNRTWSGTSCTGLGGTLTCSTYVDCLDKPYLQPGGGGLFDEPFIKFTGTLTSRCLRLTAKTEVWPTFSDVVTHMETAVLVRF